MSLAIEAGHPSLQQFPTTSTPPIQNIDMPIARNLDSWFQLYSSGTKAAATGYLVGGSDISNRYQSIAAGGIRGPLTGKYYTDNGAYDGVDLAESLTSATKKLLKKD